MKYLNTFVEHLYVHIALTVLTGNRQLAGELLRLALPLGTYPVQTSENLRPELEGTEIKLVGPSQSEARLQQSGPNSKETCSIFILLLY
jgi:hypothetical protein